MSIVMLVFFGLGNASDFQMQLQDRQGVGLVELQSLTDEMLAGGEAQSGLTSRNTTFRANVPQAVSRSVWRSSAVDCGDLFLTAVCAFLLGRVPKPQRIRKEDGARIATRRSGLKLVSS